MREEGASEAEEVSDLFRTLGLLRERIASRHDPLISCDLKSAAFDLAWLLPQISPVSSDLSIHFVGV